MNDRMARYAEALLNLPKPGYGLGFHAQSLGVATLGARAGLPPERVFGDLCQAAQGGARIEPANQIANTVRRAFADHGDGRFVSQPRPRQIIRDGALVLKRLIEEGKRRGATEKRIREMSPIHIPDRPENHAVLFLKTLYAPGLLLFCGERHDAGIIGRTIRNRDEWVRHLRGGGRTPPFIIVNPVDGETHEKKSGGLTLRGDNCVADFPYAVGEFDNIPLEDQLCFWAAAPLPVRALVITGARVYMGGSMRKNSRVSGRLQTGMRASGRGSTLSS